MYRKFSIALLLILAACSKQAAVVSVPAPSAEVLSGEFSPYEADVLLVQLEDPAQVPDWSQLPGVVSARRLFTDEPRFEKALHDFGLDRWYKLRLSGDMPATKAACDLPGIAYAERRLRPAPVALPNDPDLSRQTYLVSSSAAPDIHVAPLWEQGFSGRSDIIVAILDGGIDATHPDLASHLLASEDFTEEGLQADVHGTQVAGIVSAVRGNGIGISGIAGGSGSGDGVRLLSAQIFSRKEGKDRLGDYEAALVWAANHGALIAQNSWAFKADTDGDGSVSEQEKASFSRSHIPLSYQLALSYFSQKAGCDPETGEQRADSPMKGGLLVFASGNEGLDYNPVAADFPDALFVGATDAEGRQAAFSNHGDWVRICAPGVAVYSTMPDGGYGRASGTSFAAPQVSGVAALLVEAFGGPGFTPGQLRARLLGGAAPAVGEIGGFLDAMGSCRYGATDNRPPMLSLSPDAATIHAHETFRAQADLLDPDQDAVDLSLEGEAFSLRKTAPDRYEIVLDGKTVRAGTYHAEVTATDRFGATDHRGIDITVLPNHAPVLEKRMNPVLLRKTGERANFLLTDYFSDPDGEVPDFSVTVDHPETVFLSRNGASFSLIMLQEGRAEVTVTARDALGASLQVSFPVYAAPEGLTLETLPGYKVYSDLLILTGTDPVPTHIVLQTSTGAILYDDTVLCGAETPLRLDLSLIAPVRLFLSVSYDGRTYTKNLLKL